MAKFRDRVRRLNLLRRYNMPMRCSLTLHPDSRCAPVKRIDVDLARAGPAELALSFVVAGAIPALTLPQLAEPARTNDLWKHTCFEAFLRPFGAESYSEFNFAPSSQWAAYSFTSYRAGMAELPLIAPPRIDARAQPERFQLLVEMIVPMLTDAPRWRLGFSAVIETTAGEKSYWALAHPPGQPDFHHGDSFAYDLPDT